MKQKIYKILPHPADICVEVRGKTLKNLFINAGIALVSELGQIIKKSPQKKKILKINGIDRESLLVNWLQELLYLFYVQGLIFYSGTIKKLTDKELQGEANFLKFNPSTFQPLKEIKAVTHHDVHIKKNNYGYYVKLVFDI